MNWTYTNDALPDKSDRKDVTYWPVIIAWGFEGSVDKAWWVQAEDESDFYWNASSYKMNEPIPDVYAWAWWPEAPEKRATTMTYKRKEIPLEIGETLVHHIEYSAYKDRVDVVMPFSMKSVTGEIGGTVIIEARDDFDKLVDTFTFEVIRGVDGFAELIPPRQVPNKSGPNTTSTRRQQYSKVRQPEREGVFNFGRSRDCWRS